MSITFPVHESCTCQLQDCSGLFLPPGVNGIVTFDQYSTSESEWSTTVSGSINNMYLWGDGEYGICIHNDTDCIGDDHFDGVLMEDHGILNTDNSHLGDLNNCWVSGGNLSLDIVSTKLQIDSLWLDASLSCIGSWLAIHETIDDCTTQPDGDLGAPLANGVIGSDYEYDSMVRIVHPAAVVGQIKARAPFRSTASGGVAGIVDFHQMESVNDIQNPTAITGTFKNMMEGDTYGLVIDRYNGGSVMVNLGTSFTITSDGVGKFSIPASSVSLLGDRSVIGRSIRLTHNGQTIMQTPIGIKKCPGVKVQINANRKRS